MAGWGGSSWGGSAWGLGAGSVSFASAVALAQRTVRVELTGLPLATSAAGTGDALNPATWAVVRNDTGAAFTVLAVAAVSPTVYDLTVLENFGSWLVTHRVSADTMRVPSGGSIDMPRFAEFIGVSAVVGDSRDTGGLRDFVNLPAPRNPLGGTLQVSSAGDYVTEEGPQLVKKLIVRRLLTVPGEFFHLPTYGLGLRTKEPLPSGDLVKLRVAIEDAVRLEPEVAAASATITLADGVMVVAVRGRTQSLGSEFDVKFGVPIAS